MKSDGNSTEKAIPTNLRLLLLLEELARIGTPTTPTAANEILGLPKPTIHRLFHTLEQEGFLQRDIDGRSYSPAPRLRNFAASVLSSSRVRMVRKTVLEALVRDVGESCAIIMPEKNAMVRLDRVETHRPLRIQLPQDYKMPFHTSASGKLYLSSLTARLFDKYICATTLEAHTPYTLTNPDELTSEIAETRARGYGTNNQEYTEGMVAVAVPLLDKQDRLISTLSIQAPIQRTNLEDLLGHLPRLKLAAAELTELVLN
jgi:IclR family acetate operon transcriptional repressor